MYSQDNLTHLLHWALFDSFKAQLTTLAPDQITQVKEACAAFTSAIDKATQGAVKPGNLLDYLAVKEVLVAPTRPL